MSGKRTWIRLPRSVLVGAGVLEELEAVLMELHLDGPAHVVTSPTPADIVGDHVHRQLNQSTETVIEEASGAVVDEVVAAAADATFLVGVGGGTPIDIAKLAADTVGCGFISIPTAASHDGIVSGRSSLPDGQMRHSVAADPPLAVVADTEVLASAPWELMTAGYADIVSNATAVKDWRLAHRVKDVEYSEYAAALSEMTAAMLVDSADLIRPGVEEAAWVVAKALVSSGVAMSIAGSSRPASGAEHLISHQLDRLAPEAALHGHQVGVAAIFTEYLHSGPTGEWQQIRDALAGVGAPTTVDALGMSARIFIDAVTSAHEIRDRYTILGDGVDESAAREAAVATGIIAD
jgi:glycerol-1-phosphate dehydrogenase [NAD(P)+]